MIKVKQAVIVEGKYDKSKLSSIIDGVIITTDGFKIFTDKEKLELIKALAAKTGILILTDSDAAGFKIRHYLMGSVPKEQIYNAYIPDLYGKEKRKDKPSKEGKLGVEGIPDEVIIKALESAGITAGIAPQAAKKVTKTDLYIDGLTGGENSSALRRRLQKSLGLPELLTANSLIEVINATMTYDQYKDAVKSVLARLKLSEEE